MADVNSSISEAQATAKAAQDKAVTYTDNAQVAAQGYASANPVNTVVAPTIDVPPFNPNVLLSDSFKTDFDTEWADMETWVRGLMSDWINTYFPPFDQNLATSEDAWLKQVIDSGYSGIPIALENAIWNRARSKEMVESLRLEEEAVSQFAARGFSLPPGVLADRLLQVQMDAANKSATIARDLAIKQMDIAVDMAKLAIAEVTKLRLGIAQAIGDFMRAWLTIPQVAADVAKSKAQMQQILWQSSADYIRSLVAVAGLDMDAQKTNVIANLDLQKLDISAFNEAIGRQVNAAIAAANVMGATAAAAVGAQNTLVSENANINQNQ